MEAPSSSLNYKRLNFSNDAVYYSMHPSYTHFKLPNGIGLSIHSHVIKGVDESTYKVASALMSSENLVREKDIEAFLMNNYDKIWDFVVTWYEKELSDEEKD